MEYEQTVSSYICRYCKGSFDHLENLQKHVQQIHTVRSFSKEKNCPLCGLRCVKYETYRDHLKHIHRQSEEGKAFVLKCFNDFLVWKNELEKRNYCKYIMQGTPKGILPSNDKIHIYCCDSSTPTTKERKSTYAMKDSCPSIISAIENAKNHTVKVEYWNNHVGHVIPVQGEELDAAIDSLQTTEIVIDEQSYQGVDQDSENSIYFLNESNDGSFSETCVKETQKKQSPSLFQNSGDSSSNHTSKSAPRKFSFKKDPSKKSVSFSGSLASVACMKATVKKDLPTPTTSSTSSTIEISDSLSSCETPGMSSSKEDNTHSQITVEPSSAESLPKGESKSVSSSNPSTIPLLPTKEFISIAPSISSSQTKMRNAPLSKSVLSNLNLLVNDGKLNGQFILLNSLQSQNGQQSLILCPVDGAVPPGSQPIAISSGAKGQNIKQEGNILKGILAGSQQKGKGQVLSSITQNLVTFTGPSISQQPGKKEKKSDLKKSPQSGTPKAKKRVTRKKSLTVGQRLSLAGATSSTINAPNQIGAKIVSNTVSPNIKGIITVNSPMSNKANSSNPFPVVGNRVISNSLSPGVSYIQFNNTLFPISSPTGSNMNSSYMLASPSPSVRGPHPAQSVLSFSALAQPAGSVVRPNIINTTRSSVVGTAPINTKNKLPIDNVPVIVISQMGNTTASMPISSLSSVSSQKSATSSPVASKFTKAMKTINSSILPTIGKIRSSFIQNSAQFIPSVSRVLPTANPILKPVLPTSCGLKGLRPISSTTVANPMQVKTVQLPFSSSIANPSIPTKKKVAPTSKATDVNSVVLNTEPISSTPAITISSTPIAHPQKPGAFIFESLGDLYVLEPVEDNKAKKSDLSFPNDKGTENSDEVKSDSECMVIDHDPAENGSETDSLSNPENSEEVVSVAPNNEGKIEQKLKKPKRCPMAFSDGKKIAALPQKRPFKDDEDSEILKKIKYYNLEMKYLSSQAECKRLKLELARAHIKNKESTSSEVNSITLDQDIPNKMSENKPKTKMDIVDQLPECRDELLIDQFTNISKNEDKIVNSDENLCNKSKEQCAENELKENRKESVQISLDESLNQEMEITKDELVNENDKEMPMEYEVENRDVENVVTMDQLEEPEINSNVEENIINQKSIEEVSPTEEKEDKAASPQEVEDKSMYCFETSGNSNDGNCELVHTSGNTGFIHTSEDNNELVHTSEDNNELVHTSEDNNELVHTSEDNNELVHTSEDNNELVHTSGNMESEDNNEVVHPSGNTEFIHTSEDNNELFHTSEDNNEVVHPSGNTEFIHTSEDNNELLHTSFDDYEAMDKTMDNPQTGKEVDHETIENLINSCETKDNNTVDKCIDISETKPEISSGNVNDEPGSSAILCDRSQTLEDKSVNLETLIEKEINDFKNDQYISPMEDDEVFDSTKSNEEQITFVNTFEENQDTEETLKDLETQYGEKSSDIYTMIRTSVLRSLYADMKELCQENKKLFEELQKFKSHGGSYEVIVEETQIQPL